MNLLKLMANPLVRKMAPIVSQVLDVFGVSESSSSPELLAMIDRFAFVPQLAGLLKKTKVADFTHEKAAELFAIAGVKLSAGDVDLWVNEIETFAAGGEQSMLDFVFGPQGRALITSVLTRGKNDATSLDVAIPTFDATTGIFIFD